MGFGKIGTRKCCCSLMLLGLLANPVWGEDSGPGGLVKDSSGAPLPGVTIQLFDEHGAAVGNTTTDAQGHFNFGSILHHPLPGKYSVKLSKEGFKEATQPLPLDTNNLLFNLDAEEQEMVLKVQATKTSGPGVAPSGNLDYSVTQKDIQNLPEGENSRLLDVLVTMPGVALDQNAQVHIRDQHNIGQYEVDGILLPLDMYAEPAFINFFNPLFIKQVDLLTGVLPAQYGFSNSGGVISITTKDGDVHGGTFETYFGSRDTFQPSLQYGGTDGRFNFYVNALYDSGNTALSSATPGANPIHDWTSNEQGFGLFSYKLADDLKLSLMTTVTGSRNQLPDVPGLAPQYTLAGVNPSVLTSDKINSYLNFNDYMGALSLQGTPSDDLKWQLAYTIHSLRQNYIPDPSGELIYQGVAASVVSTNHDQALQGHVTYQFTNNTLTGGFYYGRYDIYDQNSSLVFPVNGAGAQTSAIPTNIINNLQTGDLVQGYYVNDLMKVTPQFSINMGLRADLVSGFTNGHQIDPTINFIYSPNTDSTFHAGFARYLDTPAFQAISPLSQASFNGTTNQAQPGQVNPYTQDDLIWDIGAFHAINSHFSFNADLYYEDNHHYGDEGQFGVVPIFVNLNYDHGYTDGGEVSFKYKNTTPQTNFSAYTNFTFGQSHQYGLDSGQYNFSAAEQAAITTRGFLLDHQPFFTMTNGVAYDVKPWSFSAAFLFNTGLRGGFDDELKLPDVVQLDLGVSRKFGEVTNRLTFLNVLNKVNLIRPASGIGVYQSAFGPRFSIFDTATIPFH